VGISQGAGSAIGDHNSQYNFSPVMTLIRGKHTIQFGAQVEVGYDNYFQTNIGTGGFAFNGIWTADNPKAPSANTGFPFADFVLGLAQNEGHFVNQTEGVAQVPAQTAGKQDYRAFFVADTWRIMPKLTLNLGLRYELQGTWSERFNGLTYWDPTATNETVTGCSGVAGSSCPGDIFLVTTGRNTSRNNMPLDKKEFSPRIGAAYSLNDKTVIRAGYGIFYVPNFVSFGLNPDNDVVSLASTPFTATARQLVPRLASLRAPHLGRSVPRVSSWHPDGTPSQTSRLSPQQTEARRLRLISIPNTHTSSNTTWTCSANCPGVYSRMSLMPGPTASIWRSTARTSIKYPTRSSRRRRRKRQRVYPSQSANKS